MASRCARSHRTNSWPAWWEFRLNKIIAFTFVLGSALAAVAGVMYSMYNNVLVFDAGYRVGLKAFTRPFLGGIGNIPGAVLGAMIIGLTEALTTLYVGSE